MVDEISDCDALVNMASRLKEKHFYYRSFPDRFRCGLYTSALIYDLQTNPDSTVIEHYRRVSQGVELVDRRRGQGTSKPEMEVK